MTWLLDTNTWITHFRGKNPNLSARIEATDPADIRLSAVVIAELYYGSYRGSDEHRARNHRLIEELISKYVEVPLDLTVADSYGQIRAVLAANGTPIGGNDLLIAATALRHNSILVTHNTAEFSRVTGLVFEDWQTTL